MEEIKKQLGECKDVVCALEKRIIDLETGIAVLVEQVKELGEEPRYPKERE